MRDFVKLWTLSLVKQYLQIDYAAETIVVDIGYLSNKTSF